MCVCVNHLARLSGPLMWLIKVVDNSVHCHDHDHNHNHYHNHDQHKLSNEQLSNHVFLREQLNRVCKIASLAATASQKKRLIKVVDNSVHCHDHDHNHNHYHKHDQRKLSDEQLFNHDLFT